MPCNGLKILFLHKIGFMWISIIVILVLVVVALIFYNYELQKRFEKLERGQKKLIERNADLETHQLKFALQPHTLNNILANIKAMSKHEGGILPLSVLKNYFKHSNLKVAFIS